jgi:hypothetical protein
MTQNETLWSSFLIFGTCVERVIVMMQNSFVLPKVWSHLHEWAVANVPKLRRMLHSLLWRDKFAMGNSFHIRRTDQDGFELLFLTLDSFGTVLESLIASCYF